GKKVGRWTGESIAPVTYAVVDRITQRAPCAAYIRQSLNLTEIGRRLCRIYSSVGEVRNHKPAKLDVIAWIGRIPRVGDGVIAANSRRICGQIRKKRVVGERQSRRGGVIGGRNCWRIIADTCECGRRQ